MRFRTEAKFDPSENKLQLQDKVMLLGSCFSDNIGNKLLSHKLNVCFNPLGIIYNPYSLCRLMSHYGIVGASVRPEELLHHQGVISHCDFHSTNNCLTQEEYLTMSEKKLDHFCDALLTADWLFLTFGTSWVYRDIKTDRIVSNCHKLPASRFTKELLPLNDIIHLLEDVIQRLMLINPEIRIVMTVSPVRHLKDGMVENNVSKARLLESTYQLSSKFECVQYFPSYELMHDDLRDYRFYGEDLVHPSQQAIEYIWEHFVEHFFDKETKILLRNIKKIVDAKNHRLQQPSRDSLLHFSKKNLAILAELKKKAPFLDLSEELAYFTMLKSKTRI